MSTQGDRIRDRRIELGLSQDQLAQLMGYAYRSSINRIEKDKAHLRDEDIPKIAEALKTTPQYIMGLNDGSGMRNIKLLGDIVCGTPITAEENYMGDIILPDDVNADFALICRGDSMVDAGIHDGDIAYIKQQSYVDNGTVAALLIHNTDTTIKKFYYTQNEVITLKPCNNKYKPIIFHGSDMQEVSVIGKVVAVLEYFFK